MANYDSWGQSSRGLLNVVFLQSLGGDAVPLRTHAHIHAPSGVEVSDISLGSEPPLPQDAKVHLTSRLFEVTICCILMHCSDAQSKTRTALAALMV